MKRGGEMGSESAAESPRMALDDVAVNCVRLQRCNPFNRFFCWWLNLTHHRPPLYARRRCEFHSNWILQLPSRIPMAVGDAAGFCQAGYTASVNGLNVFGLFNSVWMLLSVIFLNVALVHNYESSYAAARRET